ncbi:MAG: substrate-binding domain-containing protein, partial [Treponema sp.]|nr:substrate-binding domain-containing protein [Treponema sp.]
IIFDSYNPDPCYQEAAGFALPCVSINHYTPLFTSIVSNNFEGAYRVTKELADAGHRRIAFITGKSSHQTSVERLNGIQALCGSRGISLESDCLISGDWTFGSGTEAAKKILGMKVSRRPTAVFAFNDDLAYGCYSVLRNRGLSVPADMSLVGFDKSDRYLDMFPPITTVDVNIDAIVDYACWYLSSCLSGFPPAGQAKIQIDTTICDNGTIRILK